MPTPVKLGHKLSKCNYFILYSYHELQDLTTRMEKAAGAFGMEVSSAHKKVKLWSPAN